MDKDGKKGLNFDSNSSKKEDTSMTKKSMEVAKEVINRYKIGKNNSVLEVGAGKGHFYSLLKKESISKYLGLDISSKMIEYFLEKHPEANIKKVNFETNIELEKDFDFVIIFDTMPHLDKIDMVFKNAYKNLKIGGRFLIVHSTNRKITRNEDGDIDQKQGQIPNDEVLKLMSWTYGFEDMIVEDNDYFLFSAKRKR